MTEAALVLLRLLQYAGAVAAFGAPLFFLLRLKDTTAAAELWPRRLVAGAAVLTATSATAALVVQTAVMSGSLSEALKPETLAMVAFDTSLGLSIVARAASASVLALAAALLRPGRRALTGLVALGAVVCASFAWSGHGAATEGPAGLVHLAADIIHALAAGLWLGALAALFAILRRSVRTTDGDRHAHAALHGFSGVGTLAVTLLVGTGLVNSWFLVGPDLNGLLSTDYGRLLLLKLGLFGGMLALAGANRWLLTPALGRSLTEDPSRVRAQVAALRRSLILESALALALLAVVALMGTFPPTASLG